MDVSLLASRGWRAKTGLRDGIAMAYEDFRKRFEGAAAGAA